MKPDPGDHESDDEYRFLLALNQLYPKKYNLTAIIRRVLLIKNSFIFYDCAVQ